MYLQSSCFFSHRFAVLRFGILLWRPGFESWFQFGDWFFGSGSILASGKEKIFPALYVQSNSRPFRSLKFLAPGTSGVIPVASSPEIFWPFWLSVWPYSCPNFDLGCSPSNSTKVDNIRFWSAVFLLANIWKDRMKDLTWLFFPSPHSQVTYTEISPHSDGEIYTELYGSSGGEIAPTPGGAKHPASRKSTGYVEVDHHKTQSLHAALQETRSSHTLRWCSHWFRHPPKSNKIFTRLFIFKAKSLDHLQFWTHFLSVLLYTLHAFSWRIYNVMFHNLVVELTKLLQDETISWPQHHYRTVCLADSRPK